MSKSHSSERLSKSGRAKNTDENHKIKTAFRELKNIKRKLEFGEDEGLRSEFHSQLESARDSLSLKKWPCQSSHDRIRVTSGSKPLVYWSSSMTSFDDLDQEDYFTADSEDLALRRNLEKKKIERHYSVVNFSSDPSDFCVVRIDKGGIDNQLLENNLTKSQELKVESPRISVQWKETTDVQHPLKSKRVSRRKSSSLSPSPGRDSLHKGSTSVRPLQADSGQETNAFISDGILHHVMHQLQTKKREAFLENQVEDIKKTLRDRNRDLPEKSRASHSSLDRAAETLNILSDALTRGNRCHHFGRDPLSHYAEETAEQDKLDLPITRKDSAPKLSFNEDLIDSYSHPVQTNVYLNQFSKDDKTKECDVEDSFNNSQDRLTNNYTYSVKQNMTGEGLNDFRGCSMRGNDNSGQYLHRSSNSEHRRRIPIATKHRNKNLNVTNDILHSSLDNCMNSQHSHIKFNRSLSSAKGNRRSEELSSDVFEKDCLLRGDSRLTLNKLDRMKSGGFRKEIALEANSEKMNEENESYFQIISCDNPFESDPESSVSDPSKGDRPADSQSLTLASVQKLHREVDDRLFSSEDMRQQTDKPEKFVTYKVQKSGKSQRNREFIQENNLLRSQDKEVLIPDKRTRVKSADKQDAARSEFVRFPPKVSPAHTANDSVCVSASITVSDLFDMHISKTIPRQNSLESQRSEVSELPEENNFNLSLENGSTSVRYDISGLNYEEGYQGHQSGQQIMTSTSKKDHSLRLTESVMNKRNRMFDKARDLEYGSGLNINKQQKSNGLSSWSDEHLKNEFLSSCIEKLSLDVQQRTAGCSGEDGELNKVDAKGPPSVFEPPERDTSTHLKKQYKPRGRQASSNGLSCAYNSSATDAPDTSTLARLSSPDTLNLLRTLYQADDKTRRDLLVLAEHFKIWQKNARHQRKYREDHDKLVLLCRRFQIRHLSCKYFSSWQERAEDHRLNGKADNLYRQHMLKKGLDAFNWSIRRSLHRQDMLSQRMESIHLYSAFRKWRDEAESLRSNRLKMAVEQWRRFSLEQQRARSLRTALNRKLVAAMWDKWKAVYRLRAKQHRADYYSRRTMLSHVWLSWRDFTALSIQKRSRLQRAVTRYQEKLQRRMLLEMKNAHREQVCAKEHYRQMLLRHTFQCWCQSTKVLKSERQLAMMKSYEHWLTTTQRCYLILWKEMLWYLRAKKMASTNMKRCMFNLWKTKLSVNTEHRQQIEKQIEVNKLRRLLTIWKDNVAVQRRRQATGVYLIENVLLRQMLARWRWYSGFKVDMRQRMISHISFYNERIVAKYLEMWTHEFEKRVDEQTARRFWSSHCVRKASTQWRLICRKHQLKKILKETEPLRDLSRQRVIFMCWLEAKKTSDQEKTEADYIQTCLEKCQLQRRFQSWKTAMKLVMRIKPLVDRKHVQLVTKYFADWLKLTQHKKECRQRQKSFLKSRLHKAFCKWRRQHLIHQIERAVRHRLNMGLLFLCLDEWHLIIRRKRSAQLFHNSYLVQDMFKLWRHRTQQQIEQKARTLEEKMLRESLKSYYFALWWSNVQEQISKTEETISLLGQQQAGVLTGNTFYWWRGHLKHTRASKAYRKVCCERLLRSAFINWLHAVSGTSLTSAVQHFTDEIRLTTITTADGPVIHTASFSFEEDGLLDEQDITLCRSTDDSSSSLPYRRLVSDSMKCAATDDCGQAGSDDIDGSSSLLSSTNDTLGTSMLVDRDALRRIRIRNIVVLFVTRLRLWPASVVFEEWKEFTARRRELKYLAAQACVMHDLTMTAMFLCDWKNSYTNMLKACSRFNTVLMSKALKGLCVNRQRRQEKKELSALAVHHSQLIVCRKVFPVWLAKTQDRQHEHHIFRLWSTTTSEEQQLLPLESELQHKFVMRSLQICFAIWSLKFQFASKIKHVYYTGIMKRCLVNWKTWSQTCQEHKRKVKSFAKHRLQGLVFRTWRKQFKNKKLSNDRYHKFWKSYLHLVVTSWKEWSKVSQVQRLSLQAVVQKADSNLLRTTFNQWRHLSAKLQAMQHNRDVHLTHRVFEGWQLYQQERRRTRQLILAFQVKCYTNLVKRLFRFWQQVYVCHLREKARYQEVLHLRATKIGVTWRKKARVSRGKRLHTHLLHNKIKQYFRSWKTRYQLCLEREQILEDYLARRSHESMHYVLMTWHTQLEWGRAGRVYNNRLQLTVMKEWRTWASGSRDRRIRGLALKRALKERRLTVYLKMWCEMTRVRQMVQQHSHLRLQLRVFRAWEIHTRQQATLRCIQVTLRKKVNTRLLHSALMSMRCRFDYCQGLADIARSVQEDRNRKRMKQTIMMWQVKLDAITAARCYGKFLVIRTVRQWRRFVYKKTEERRMEREKMDVAVKHYNRKLCKLAVQSLCTEVKVKHSCIRRRNRLALKYARQWKQQTDLAYTARCMNKSWLYSLAWTTWRVALSERQAATSLERFEKRHLLSKVFSAWQQITMKKTDKSSIPEAAATAATSSSSSSQQPGISAVSSGPTSHTQIPSLQSRYSYSKISRKKIF